jgi:hypothetical protein
MKSQNARTTIACILVRMNNMTLKQFIKDNKVEIDKAIKTVVPDVRLSDSERRLWILNDEGLYMWARSSGVRI